jgi:hypothetical protein
MYMCTSLARGRVTQNSNSNAYGSSTIHGRTPVPQASNVQDFLIRVSSASARGSVSVVRLVISFEFVFE